MGDRRVRKSMGRRTTSARSTTTRRSALRRRATRAGKASAKKASRSRAGGASRKRAAAKLHAGRPTIRIYVLKAGTKSHRHVTPPATATEIARSLGLTHTELASASALIDRLGL